MPPQQVPPPPRGYIFVATPGCFSEQPDTAMKHCSPLCALTVLGCSDTHTQSLPTALRRGELALRRTLGHSAKHLPWKLLSGVSWTSRTEGGGECWWDLRYATSCAVLGVGGLRCLAITFLICCAPTLLTTSGPCYTEVIRLVVKPPEGIGARVHLSGAAKYSKSCDI